MIDVGQGDSILIELPYNKGNILIDTGGKLNYNKENWQKRNTNSLATSTIIPYLKSKGIRKIDYLILTHGDDDHMGESNSLINNFEVGKVIFNKGYLNNLESELVKLLKDKKINYVQNINQFKINKYKFHVLNTKEYDNENDNSIVIYTKINNNKILLMGDAGVDKEKDILKKYNLKNIDILKVGHHGSNTSSSKEFTNKIKPKTCLILVGEKNKFGHPKASVLDILKKCNIYRTDINGSIEIKLKNNDYKIKTINP